MSANKKEIMALEDEIAKLVHVHQELDAICVEAEKLGMMDPNGRLFEAIWRGFDVWLNLTDRRTNGEGLVSWFIYDNDCGKNGLEAESGSGKMKKIKTPLDLAKLILSE